MSSTIVKLLTWVKHEIHKRFHLFYIVCQFSMILMFFCNHFEHFSQCSSCSYQITLSMILYMNCAVYTILLSSCLILSLFSVVLFSESKMSSCHTSLSVNSLMCCHSLTTKLDYKNLIMCSCKKCVSHDLTYHVNKNSSKCNECTCASFWKCNLILSETEWVKVQHKQLHLCQKIWEITVWLTYLQKQSDLIKSCWEEMI